jgi:hypothetical protein
MSSIFVGVRIEISNRSNKIKDINTRYFDTYKTNSITDYHENGKVTIERKDGMLIAHGKEEDKFNTGLINFSVMNELEGEQEELQRLIKIVNVLGNDRLIKEKVSVFVEGKSMLNNIKEFGGLVQLFKNINKLAPGFIDGAWYYAPEATLEK